MEPKAGLLEVPDIQSQKAALNAYTRILAKKHSSFCINAVCPGFLKTDFNYNAGCLSVDEGAESVVGLALFLMTVLLVSSIEVKRVRFDQQ